MFFRSEERAGSKNPAPAEEDDEDDQPLRIRRRRRPAAEDAGPNSKRSKSANSTPAPPDRSAGAAVQRTVVAERRQKALRDIPARARADSPPAPRFRGVRTSTLPPVGDRSAADPHPKFRWKRYLEFDPCECRRAEDASLSDMEDALGSDSQRAEPTTHITEPTTRAPSPPPSTGGGDEVIVPPRPEGATIDDTVPAGTGDATPQPETALVVTATRAAATASSSGGLTAQPPSSVPGASAPRPDFRAAIQTAMDAHQVCKKILCTCCVCRMYVAPKARVVFVECGLGLYSCLVAGFLTSGVAPELPKLW